MFSVTGLVQALPISLTIDAIDRENIPEGCPCPITVRLSAPVPAGQVVTVQYATSDGTAISVGDCRDFYPATGTLTFTAGQQVKGVTVFTVEDGRVEAHETFQLTLSNPSANAALGKAIATNFINGDGDNPGANGLSTAVTELCSFFATVTTTYGQFIAVRRRHPM